MRSKSVIKGLGFEIFQKKGKGLQKTGEGKKIERGL